MSLELRTASSNSTLIIIQLLLWSALDYGIHIAYTIHSCKLQPIYWIIKSEGLMQITYSD